LKQICVRIADRWEEIIRKAIREGLFESPEEFVTVAIGRLAADIEKALRCRVVIENPDDVGEIVRPCTYIIGGDEVVITDTLSKDEFVEFVEGVRMSKENDDIMSTYLSLGKDNEPEPN